MNRRRTPLSSADSRAAAITAIRAREADLIAAIANTLAAADIAAFVRVQSALNDVFRWESERGAR